MGGLTILLALALSIWALALGLTLWGTWVALKLLRATPPHLDMPFNLFPVSVLKPLKGVDEGLAENLESFFLLDYPDYELLFCVARADDPARAVAEDLMSRHPGVQARLLVGEETVGPNPKVNNMMRAYDRASNDWVLVSDSNVRVRPDYLRRLVAHLEPGVGLVTSVVLGADERGLGGHLEALYLNTFYARGMGLADAFGHACVIGKSMLFQRSTARRFGGLRMLGRFLAEDYMAGEAMRRLGLRVVLAVDPVRQVIGHHAFDSFWKRHLRWGRIRKNHGAITFLLEPWVGAIVSGLLGAWAARAAWGVPSDVFLLCHLGAWSTCDLVLMRRLGADIHWRTPIAWFAREALALPLWIHIARSNTVDWRGQRLTLRPGGVLETTP